VTAEKCKNPQTCAVSPATVKVGCYLHGTFSPRVLKCQGRKHNFRARQLSSVSSQSTSNWYICKCIFELAPIMKSCEGSLVLPQRARLDKHRHICHTLRTPTCVLWLFIVTLLPCQMTYSQETADDCQFCDAGSYAENPGSTQCTPCGEGTFTPLSGQGQCDPCRGGTFFNQSHDSADHLCDVTKTVFVVQRGSSFNVSWLSAPDKTNWFQTLYCNADLRLILNYARIDWATGNSIRIGSTPHRLRLMNPTVLYHTSNGVF